MSAMLTERAWCVVVPHSALGARMARQRLTTELSGAVRPELLADAVAVMAELVGNAVRHGDPLPGDVVRVAWKVRPGGESDQVEVRVTDGGGRSEPHIRSVGVDSMDGRGLCIVEALAKRWGVERDGLGQSVWAEIG